MQTTSIGVFIIEGGVFLLRHDPALQSAMIQQNLKRAEQYNDNTGEKQRDFIDLLYVAKTWQKKRHIIAKLEVTDKGPNSRFLVTNLPGSAQVLYDTVYWSQSAS